MTSSWLSTNVTRLFLTIMSTNGCIVFLSAADCQQTTNQTLLFFSFCQQSTDYTVRQASIMLLLFFYQQLIVNKFHSTVLHHIVNKVPSIIRASKHQYCLYYVIISSWLSTNFTTLLFIALSTNLGLTYTGASKQLVKRKRWASSTLSSVCNSISNFSCFPL